MHPKHLLRKWPSVSTAAAMLLGLQRTEASTGELSVIDDVRKGDLFEPLILKPPNTKVIPEHLFAGHRSHSSHSSHRSHSSHSSGSSSGHASHASGTSSGVYTPTNPRPPTYAPSVITPRATPRPMPSQPPATRIELTNGAVIYGTVLVKSAAGITLKGVDQKSYKIPRLILAASTVASLALPPEQ